MGQHLFAVGGKIMPTALMFSGQGSQYVGMMQDLVETFELARTMVAKADEIVGYSLSNIAFYGPEGTLKETRYTQPALFVHEALLIELLRDTIAFGAVAGHSLGEYSALYAAGVLDFETALRLVQLRGQLMFEAGEKLPGTMFAVIGMDDAKVVELCHRLHGGENVVVAANFNAPGQVVISGSAQYLREHVGVFKEEGARMVVELPVSGAFHSPLLASAQERLAEAIGAAEFRDARVDVYCNVDATPIRTAEELRTRLVQQLVSPVLWTQTMGAMHSAGFDDFCEIGPGAVLQGLAKRTLKGVSLRGFDKAASVQAVFSN